MNEPQSFFGAILKPFAGNTQKSTNMEEKRNNNCSSPRDLPNDPTDPESDADSYQKQAEEDGDDELPVEGDDFAPVMPTKPFTKRGSFLSMFRKSNSSRMMIDPKVLEAAEETEKEGMEKENNPTANNDNNKGNKTNEKNPSNDETQNDKKSPDVKEDESTAKMGGLLEMFFKPKETMDADAKANSADDNDKVLDKVPSKEATAASNEGETDDKNIDNEQTPDSEDNKEGLGFFGKLFQRKDLPDIKEENDATLASAGVDGAVENAEHVESMYQSAKEYLDSSDETNSSEANSEAAVVEDVGDEKALMQSENLESPIRSSASSQKRSSSFIGKFFDSGASTEEVLENQTETEHPAKESLAQDASQTEKEDSVGVSQQAQFYPEETGLELEASNSEVPLPLDDPYKDDNEKSQKEQVCCSFPFC